MKTTGAITALLGLILFTGVLAWQGTAAVSGALAAAGWGLAVVAVWHLVPLVIDSHAWRLLFSAPRPGVLRIVWARWIGESVNGLLPVAQVGGDIAKARLIILSGYVASETSASVVVDTTMAAITQMLFAITGLILLLVLLDRPDLAFGLALGIAVMFAMLGLFYCAQRGGLFATLASFLKRIGGGRGWLDFVGGAQALDRAIGAIYQRREAVLGCLFWRLVGWFAGVGEVWLALYFLGHPVALLDALMLESLGQAVRGAAFAIPGALGVQEGGYVLLGSLIGLPAETGLALALAKRVRELTFGIPGLLAWQWAESQTLRRRRAAPSIRQR